MSDAPDPDAQLFGGGLSIRDYFIDRTHTDPGIVGFRKDGREYDLLMSDERYADAVRRRLIELGVEIRR